MKTLRCSKIGVALSFLLLPIASLASDWTSVAEPVEFTDVMTASADEAVFYFEASLTDGTKLSYPFAEQPTLRNQGNDLVLTTTKEEVLLPQGSVKQFTVLKKTASTGIGEVSAKAQMVRTGNVLRFSNCRAGAEVNVYDPSGRKVLFSSADTHGECEVSLQGQPQGVYVVRTETLTCKILKK